MGIDHIWLPYAQMKTMWPPLPVVGTQGCRITLADGRELIDGIASWWTACHGYNHPHIRAAVARQFALMPHVMFGGRRMSRPLTLAQRLAGLLPGDLDRVFFSESGSVAVEVAHEDGGAVLDQSRRGGPHALRGLPGRLSRRYHRRHGGVRSGCRHARAVCRTFARAFIVDLPQDDASEAALDRTAPDTPASSPAFWSSRWCRARAA